MKRLTAAILALVITLTLCACGATGNTGAASAGNKPKKIEKPVADTLDGILEAIFLRTIKKRSVYSYGGC